MSNSDPFRTYLRQLQKNLSTGVASEHTHRSALEELNELAAAHPDTAGLDAVRALLPCPP